MGPIANVEIRACPQPRRDAAWIADEPRDRFLLTTTARVTFESGLAYTYPVRLFAIPDGERLYVDVFNRGYVLWE
jgi:hypothetical protein